MGYEMTSRHARSHGDDFIFHPAADGIIREKFFTFSRRETILWSLEYNPSDRMVHFRRHFGVYVGFLLYMSR